MDEISAQDRTIDDYYRGVNDAHFQSIVLSDEEMVSAVESVLRYPHSYASANGLSWVYGYLAFLDTDANAVLNGLYATEGN